MDFEPKEEHELYDLLPEGEYDFYVKGAEKHLSKAGNLSIKLTLAVYNEMAKEYTLSCYLSPKYAKTLKHFCDATGLEEQYKKGSLLPEMCVNMSGRVKVAVREPEPGSNFERQNEVKDFKKGKPGSVKKPAEEPFNDDIPF